MLYRISKIDLFELLDNLLAKKLPASIHGRCKLIHSKISESERDSFNISLSTNYEGYLDIRLHSLSKIYYYDWPGYEQAMLIHDL